MARKERVNYSIDGDVLDAFEAEVPSGDRSAAIESLLEEEYVND